MPKLRNVKTGEIVDTDLQQGGAGGAGLAQGNEMIRNLLLLQALTSAGSVQGSRYADLYKLLEPEKPSAEEEKREYSKDDAERVMQELEQAYFFNERGPLTYGTKGYEGRLAGVVEGYKAGLSADYNPELLTYLATRDSIKPRFAKAMGDVGNLSRSEQEQAVKDIPTGKNTYEEAKLFFNSKRRALGLKERDFDLELQGAGIENTVTGEGEVLPITFKSQKTKKPSEFGRGLEEVTQTTREILPKEQQEKPSGAQYADVNLPLSGAGTELGALLGRFLPAPPGVRTLAGGAAGEAYQRYGEKFPVNREARLESLGLDPNMTPLQAASPLNLIKASYNLAKPAAPYAALDALFNLRGIRNAVAGSTGGKTISGGKVAQAGVDYATGAPATAQKQAQKYALQGIEKFGGKEMTLPQALADATRSQARAFTTKGIGKPVASQYEAAIAQNLRDQIAQASPLTGYLTTGISKIINMQNILKKLAGLLIPTAVGGAAGYFGGRAAGRALGGE